MPQKLIYTSIPVSLPRPWFLWARNHVVQLVDSALEGRSTLVNPLYYCRRVGLLFLAQALNLCFQRIDLSFLALDLGSLSFDLGFLAFGLQRKSIETALRL